MIQIEGIKLVLSYKCNLRCRHCFFTHNNQSHEIPVSLVESMIIDAQKVHPLKWFHISGGEPFLSLDTLQNIISIAHNNGIENIGVASNAFWATSEQNAISVLRSLIDSGLTGLCISADSFHQQYLPLERVRNALLAMKHLGVKGHCHVVGCYLESHPDAETRNKETDSILQAIGSIYAPTAKIHVRHLGNGSPHPESAQSIEGQCDDLCVCLGNEQGFTPRMITVDSYGMAHICQGIVIGNIHYNSLSDILKNYKPANNPITEAIHHNGPSGIVNLARQYGFLDNSFAGKCDACFRARRFLRHKFPDVLTPNECYPE